MGIVYSLGGKVYDFLDAYFEKTRYKKIRKNLLRDFKGNILDAGCGTGRNFKHYHPKAKVIGVDISPKMLEIARQKAKESKAQIKVDVMDLKSLSFKGNTFDSIVASFVLCVMPEEDERAALKELVRVAKPGARLYFLEYVYSKYFLRRLIMKSTSLVPKLLYSIRFNSTFPVIKEEKSLKIEKLEFVHDDVVRLIVAKKLI